MAPYLHGKTVIITGAAQGIGYAIAENVVKNGAKVTILIDINEQKGGKAASTLNAVYGENKAHFIKCDVTEDLEKVSNVILSEYGAVDVLINNAGILDEKSIKNALKVDLIALMEWTMKFWNHMRTDKGGQGGTILNMSSILGFRHSIKLFPYLKAAKHGVMGFSRTLGHKYNFEKYGVRVLVICPGCTDTPMAMVTSLKGADVNYEESYYIIKTKRRQDPDLVGQAAVQLLNEAESGTAWLIENGEKVERLMDYFTNSEVDNVDIPSL